MRFTILLLGAVVLMQSLGARAAEIFWSGGTGSYNNPASWTGGVVPGVADSAINDNGLGNVVQIKIGDPNWLINQLIAGKSGGNGAFEQNGQTLSLTNSARSFRLGLAAGRSGVYTLNNGTIGYGGQFSVGELGTGTFNLQGGLIAGSGNMAINAGNSTHAVSATLDGGTNKTGHTWFERGFYTADATRGLPPAGSTFNHEAFGYPFKMPSSYAANNAFLVAADSPTATITMPPTAASTLSLLAGAGDGPVTNTYVIHFSGAPDETGTIAIPDWYNNDDPIAIRVGGRVQANGMNFQNVDGAIEFPRLFGVEIPLVNTTSPITGIDLVYVSGGRACVMAVSAFTGSGYAPVAITGFNADIVMESGAPVYVSPSVTDTFTQTAGSIDIGGELWVGNVGSGVFNMSGGTNYFRNWSAIGRSGGKGVMTVTGGEINKLGNGNFVIGTAYQTLPGATTAGVLNHSGGTINVQNEYWVAEGGTGTNNISGSAVLNLGNWVSIGRGGAAAVNLAGGTINKTGGGNWIVADNGTAYFKQTGGTVTVNNELWIGQWHDGVGQYDLVDGSFTNNSWLAVGREGGDGVLNISGGFLTKQGGGNIVLAHGHNDNGTIYEASGVVNQSGGVFTCVSGQTWIGEDNGPATWNMSGGIADLLDVQIAVQASSIGTLNLDGGTMAVREIAGGNGSSTVNFNGGTLVAKADNPSFLHGLSAAYVNAGGAIIDTDGFDVGVQQALYNGGGGLTKNGEGALSLFGDNSYAGPTVVNAGKLMTSTTSTGGGDYTIASGAGLGVTVHFWNAQLYAQNLTLGGVAGGSLDFDLGAFGNPSAAPVSVNGTFNVNGVITVNIADALPQTGMVPLISYGSRSGSGSFVLGDLPVGVMATIGTNGNSIVLNIANVNLPRWDGQVSGNWDIGLTENWINIGTGLPTYYGEGNFVLFDDNAVGTTTVNLTTTVNPGSVTVNNNGLPYTLTGTGKIAGPTELLKQGAGTLAIASTVGNLYTGPTIIEKGTLSVSNLANGGLASAIGSSSASPTNLVLGDAVLSYGGPATTINRGYRITSTNSTIDVQTSIGFGGQVLPAATSRLTKTGPGVLRYTGSVSNLLSGGEQVTGNPGLAVKEGLVEFDGAAGRQTNRIQRDVWVGSTPEFGGHLALTNATLLVDGWLAVGRGNGSGGLTSSLTLENALLSANGISFGYWNNLPGNYAFQNVTLRGSSVLTNRGGNNLNIAESAGSTTTMDISGNSIVSSGPRLEIGGGGGVGMVTLSDSAQLYTGNWLSIGNGVGSQGTVTARGNSSLYAGGDFNVSDTQNAVGTLSLEDSATASGGTVFIGKADTTSGTLNMSGTPTLHSRGHVRVADGGDSTGTVNMNGGTVLIGNEFWVGEDGKGYWTQTAGDVYSSNWVAIGRNNHANCEGIYTISGGSLSQLNTGSRLIVGSSGRGTLDISGTANVFAAGEFQVGENGSANGTVNLNGGTITARRVVGGAGTSTFNWIGGKIVARSEANPDFMTGLTAAYIQGGGAVIDSGTNVINIAQPLLDGFSGGGLTKLGSGTVNLNGANSYTGPTLVNAGALGGSGSISGPVTVAATGTLAPGTSIGTLTVNNNVTLAGAAVMEISADGGVLSSDRLIVSGTLAYGGVLNVMLTGTNALAINDTFDLVDAGATSGTFASVNLPLGYLWDISQLYTTGSIRVVAISPPIVNPPVVVDGKLVLTGIGGPPGAAYTWVTSPDVSAPLPNWTPIGSGTFDSAGGYSNAFPVNATEPARFFRIKTP